MIYQFFDIPKVHKYSKTFNSFFKGHLYFREKFYDGNIDNILDVVASEEELESTLKQFNGNFCLVCEREDKTYLAVDRIMSFPLFYAKVGADVYISDAVEQVKLKAGINSVNKKTAKEFKAAGFVLSDSTVFSGIKFVLAGTYVVIDNLTGNISVKRYFRHIHGNYLKGNMDQLALMLETVTDNVFRRLVKELNGRQVALFLSGGYDSRLVAVMLHKLNYSNVVCFSFMTRQGREEDVAKEIAKDLGYKWILLNSVEIFNKIKDDTDYEKYLLEASSGIVMPYLMGCMLKGFLEDGTLNKNCVVITGNSGDVIEGNAFSQALMEKDAFTKDEIVQEIVDTHCYLHGMEYGRQRYIRNLVAQDIPDKEIYSCAEAQDIYELYNWQHRQTKYIVSDIRAYDIYLNIDWRLPLWDNELVDFWLRIPIEFREKRKLYYYYLKEQKWDDANGISFYSALREKIRNKALYILKFFYPIRKIYEYELEKKWIYYGVDFKEYLNILRITGGYKMNDKTTRVLKFFNTYYHPLFTNKDIPSKLVLKVVLSEWKNASRDKRELSVAKELGAEVLVLAKGEKSGVVEEVEGFPVYRMSARPLGKHIPKALNKVVAIFTWGNQIRKIAPQIISGHDLDGLTVGWLSGVFLKRSKKPKLVYDSHEFELGIRVKCSRLQTKLITYWERFMIKCSTFMIVVNDSIADEVVKIHKLKERPVVVRNIPPRWDVDPKVCAEVREQLFRDLSGKIILIYHGVIMEGRGIEKCIKLLTYDEELCLLVLGDAAVDSYRKSLEKYVEQMAVKDRVLFHEAVSQSELWKYVGAADIGMIIGDSIHKSYFLSLPNKLFESIQAHIPIIGSDFPEIKKIICQYKVGEVCRYDDMADIYRAVKKIKDNKEKQEQYRKNAEEASKVLCWEKEKDILKKAYQKILL